MRVNVEKEWKEEEEEKEEEVEEQWGRGEEVENRGKIIKKFPSHANILKNTYNQILLHNSFGR